MPSFRQSVRELVHLLAADSARSRRLDVLKECQARSMQLLKENLSAAQRKQYERYNYFEVMGGATRRRYRIRLGHQMNVEQLDDAGGRVRLLCFMPEGCRWFGDVMLAQKIALELFETDALRAAHKSPALDLCWICNRRDVFESSLGDRAVFSAHP
jgi:hypothetical protein